MDEEDEALDFAPCDSNDFRNRWEWSSKYPERKAKFGIWGEAIYLLLLVVIDPLLIAALWLGYPNKLLHLSTEQYHTFITYGFACLGGMLGGILFDLKWLYHSVAKGRWHEDRRLWRIVVPFISAGLAFALMALVASDVFDVLNRRAVTSYPFVISFTFIVGYFSDNAIAKLSQLAQSMFGRHPDRKPAPQNDGDSAAH